MVSASASKSTESGSQTQDAFNRLVKSISGRNESVTSSSTLVEQSSPPELPPKSSNELPKSPSFEMALQRVISSASSETKLKKRSKIADRLKKIGQDLGNLKFRQNESKSVPASPRVTVDEILTPVASTSTNISSDESTVQGGHAKLLSMVAEVEERAPEGASSDPPVVSTSNPADPAEPTTIAQRIQALIDSLPFPTTNPDKKIPVPKNPKPPARGPDGRPIPPSNASPIKDSKLLGFLSSPTIMNGSTLKGKPSIWSILDTFGPPPHGYPPTDDESPTPGRGEGQVPIGDDSGDKDTIFSDNSSVMIYSPLIPTNEDLVELAELVPVGIEEEPVKEIQSPITGASWTTMWPLSLWYGEPPSGDKTPMAAHRLSGETVISPRHNSVDSTGHLVRTHTVQAWVPSNTKLSLQAMWWGYRLYLPPPVLAILSDKTLEATKRASMITTALTWFFNNLPVNSLPPPVRPAALLLQRLVPYLGYIGTFISWSWSTIKSYNIGYGVILTATWLLPIALIPGTWHENEFPTSPNQPPAIPLPPTSPPLSQILSLPSTSPPSSPAPTSPSLPATSPGPGSPSTLSDFTSFSSSLSTPLSPVSSSNVATSYYARIVVDIPVPSSTPEPITIPPPPPEVPLGSPLMEQLLHGPVIPTVPLPDEDAPMPYVAKSKKDGKSRAKALFKRSSKSR
ncbi:hypothetical protein BDN70DRAFT_873290 [Pholiota conissans]|uniref:Uncharacterized protein n=1 Tax=Pholiota conissans TaxID=109636 RepID=A0A9P5ZA23_9AGAR|nr:hypothetical protein BDN70DRAFT_873290 [Pholiota conissans]